MSAIIAGRSKPLFTAPPDSIRYPAKSILSCKKKINIRAEIVGGIRVVTCLLSTDALLLTLVCLMPSGDIRHKPLVLCIPLKGLYSNSCNPCTDVMHTCTGMHIHVRVCVCVSVSVCVFVYHLFMFLLFGTITCTLHQHKNTRTYAQNQVPIRGR